MAVLLTPISTWSQTSAGLVVGTVYTLFIWRDADNVFYFASAAPMSKAGHSWCKQKKGIGRDMKDKVDVVQKHVGLLY